MGIFNRAIPNIQTNNLNQVRVTRPEEYYVDDIFDPLFNAKVKEQLRAKYGNPFLGTIGGYMEGIDNALIGQDGRWGILGSGMGILSGFGRSMDKAGDFIIGGLTEGVKGITGQGFENPLENVFVEDQDYTGTRLLAAMGNSMAGLAKAPQLTEADFTGLWNIPAMGLELGTDPGILGGAISKGASSLNLANSVASSGANGKLAKAGQLLSEYDDFMAKVSMDLTAPGLRLGAKSLLDKIRQKLGSSDYRPLVNVILNDKETPEARIQAQEMLRNDPEVKTSLEMADEVSKAEAMIEQANLTNNVNLNDAQVALGMGTTVPAAVQEEFEGSITDRGAEILREFRRRRAEEVREAYFLNVIARNAWKDEYAKAYGSALDDFNAQVLHDMRHAQFSDDKSLQYAKDQGYITTENLNLSTELSKNSVEANRTNYENIRNTIKEIPDMSPEELSLYGYYPEYVEQIYFPELSQEDIDAGLFYDFVPNEATRNAVLVQSGISPKDIKGLYLDTPVTFSPSDYTGISDKTLVSGLKAAELKLYHAFESAGVSLREFKTPEDLDKLLDTSTSQGSKFETAFPNDAIRKDLVEKLKVLVFPEAFTEGKDPPLKNGAIAWLNTLNDFSNEIITFNKNRTAQRTPAYTAIVQAARAKGIEPTELIAALRNKYPQYADENWNSLLAERDIAEQSLQGSLWHNLVSMAESYQKDIYAPLKHRQSVGYTPSGLELKDGYGLAQDIGGKRVEAGTDNVTLNATASAKPKSDEFDLKAFKTKKFKENIKTDYGKRQVSYANSAEDYHTNRYLTTVFRRNQEAFKDPVKFVDLRDTVLKRLGKHYQVKLRSDYFFNVPSSTRVKDIDFSKQSEMANFIRDEGRDIVKAFNTDVRPAAEALLKDGVIPWSGKFKPRIPKNPTPAQQACFDRVTLNQSIVREALGYEGTPHRYYKEFRNLSKTLPIEMHGGVYKFKTTGVPITTPVVGTRKLNYTYSDKITYNHLTVQDFVDFQNAKISSDWREPVKVPNVTSEVKRLIGDAAIRPNGISIPSKDNVLPSTKAVRTTYKNAQKLPDSILENIKNAPADEAAEAVVNMPSPIEAAQEKVFSDLNIPVDDMRTLNEMSNTPPDLPNPSSGAPKALPRASTPKAKYELFKKLSEAVVAKGKSTGVDKATLRTDFVKQIFKDAELLMTKYQVSNEDIAKFKRAQIYLEGARVRKEEFLDTLASSGMFQMAYKPGEDFSEAYAAITNNIAEINVAMGANVLKPLKHKLPNGNTVIGAMWDTSNKKILNIVEKNYKEIDFSKLDDVVRLDSGGMTDALKAYISTPKYRLIEELFDKVRQQEGDYARLIGFKYDDARHIKNVRKTDADVANYFANILYKDIAVSDLDDISDKMMELEAFKHLRGSWGTRKFDKRFIGYIEDFEADGIRLFEDDAVRIVKGSFADGSFNNSKFQLYVDLFENDNFKINTYFKDIDDLKKIFYAKLEDGTQSGNLHNLVLAAPRKDATGRVIGFTQFDKTTDLGLAQALKNPDTVLLPAHVLSPLDKVLRKDAKMSNKVYAFINKHLTLPFKFGVLMNPGFLLGNASDAYLKQATTMAQKYGTSVPEELANVATAIRDVMVLNNNFDDAYRRFLVHIQAEGFPIAPSHQISSLAATDPRIRKLLKDYVDNKLQKGKGQPLIDCRLSAKERNTVKLWLMLNSVHTATTLSDGFQDLDIIAKAKNSSKYQLAKNPIDRVLTGQGEYVADDVSTWGLFVNNPVSRAIMNGSEAIENTFRAASILNDFRHKGMDSKWFAKYFKNLDDLKAAADIDPDAIKFRDALKQKFNVDMSEGINTMHNANFDYERMTDFTDTVGTFVPFPTFFLKNLGYWLDILVNRPQYIDHAITVQESMWGSRDTSEDKFAAEAKGRGAIPISVGGQNLSKFFKGIYKPTPLQSMFGAFSLINNPVSDMYYRLHPMLSSGITAASKLPPIEPIAADLLPSEEVKYRPYSTDMYERNVTRDDPNFNLASYAIHRANPMERTTQAVLRLPDKLKQGEAQLSDFLPSIFQPDFGEKYVK